MLRFVDSCTQEPLDTRHPPLQQVTRLISRVERDEYRRPKTYAVRAKFSLFLICWVEREKLLFLFFESRFDDAMNMENDNINNSLECLK